MLAVDLNGAGVKALAGDVPGIEPVVCDLSDLEAVDALPAEVDVLVNNAGLQHVAPVHEFDPDGSRRSSRSCWRRRSGWPGATLPHMYDRGWGRVVNISSVHGLRASPFKSAYVTAKHGLEGLSKVIALEGAPGTASPATASTRPTCGPRWWRSRSPTRRATTGSREDEVVEKIMLTPVAVKRLVEPDEVAELAAVLYGPASASLTGTSLTLDGGWTAH